MRTNYPAVIVCAMVYWLLGGVRIANSWIIFGVGRGPTPDNPESLP